MATRALQSLAITVECWDNRFISAEDASLAKLVGLLASDNDELFVEAVLTTAQLMSRAYDLPCIIPSEFITTAVIPRLIRLLSFDEGWMAGRAALALGKMACVDNDVFTKDIRVADQLIASGGVPPLIRLLSSNNLDVARAASRAVGRICWTVGSAFLIDGIIAALVNRLSRDFDAHTLLNVNILTTNHILESTAGSLKDALIQAGAIPIVVRLLNLQAEGKVLSIWDLRHLLRKVVHRSDVSRVAFIDANGARPLLRWIADLPKDFPKEGFIELITPFIHHSCSSRAVFRAAGAEQVLSDYLSIWKDMATDASPYSSTASDRSRRVKEASDALDLLRLDPAH